MQDGTRCEVNVDMYTANSKMSKKKLKRLILLLQSAHVSVLRSGATSEYPATHLHVIE